jgi:flavodoxin
MVMKSLLIVSSYHHQNTAKIADVIAKVLEAQVKSPQQINPEELHEYGLIGFGSGIYSEQHHPALLDLVGKLPQITGRKAFVFSTFGVPAIFIDEAQLKEFVLKNHSALRKTLQSKGYIIVDEFSCVGFNINSFLKLFGGINKGRPNAEDLKHAEEFAQNLKQNTL